MIQQHGSNSFSSVLNYDLSVAYQVPASDAQTLQVYLNAVALSIIILMLLIVNSSP